MKAAGRGALEDRRASVERDLAELEQQVAAGEIDERTADELRRAYVAERLETDAELERAADAPETRPRSLRRALVGNLIVTVGIAALVWGVVASVAPRSPGGNLTGGIVEDVVEAGGVDLSDVTNEEMEAVVAANPEVLGMRVALARRYFEAFEYGKAFEHYFAALEIGGPDQPEPLANIGWITFLESREFEVAESYVTRALAIRPDYPEAHWFLANIRLYGLNDPAGAVQPLERLLEFEDLPDEIVSEARTMLDQARAEAP